jgi:aromatic ring hydroxylase
MTETLGSSDQTQVQTMIAEIIENLEVTKACLRTAEVDAFKAKELNWAALGDDGVTVDF